MIDDINDYLNSHERQYRTKDFIYNSYNSPNTMYQVSNNLDELLLTLSFSGLKMWHRCMSLLKRNGDPTIACTIVMNYHSFCDILSQKYYYIAMKELQQKDLLLATRYKNRVIVNIDYANKLYKPKLEI